MMKVKLYIILISCFLITSVCSLNIVFAYWSANRFFCPEERRLKATLNKISFERGPQGEWGPGSARARVKSPKWKLFRRARARGPRTPFTLRTRFRGKLVTCRTLR